MSSLAKIAWVLVAVLVYQILIGLFVADDDHEVWSRPLIFVILFSIFLAYYWWRHKRGTGDDE